MEGSAGRRGPGRGSTPVVDRVFARWWYVPLATALVLALPIALLGERAAARPADRLEAALAERAEQNALRGAAVAHARLEEVGQRAGGTASDPAVRSALAAHEATELSQAIESMVPPGLAREGRTDPA